MGLVRAEIELFNPSADELKPIAVSALVDSGSTWLVIPQHVANQLMLPVLEKREVVLADGATKVVDYAGPVRLRFDGRNAFSGALIMGDEVLLGAIPMEDMDLIIHPLRRLLMANPKNPNIPGSMAVSVRPGKRGDNA